MEATPINEEIRSVFSFLETEFPFTAQSDFSGITYDSAAIRIYVTWYRDPGVLFWTKQESYWIRAADGRTFDLFELVRFKRGPSAVVGFDQVPAGDLVAYLRNCAELMKKYAA